MTHANELDSDVRGKKFIVSQVACRWSTSVLTGG